jgi:type IV secretion system protein VirD4
LQSLSQLKGLYKDSWNAILGNCALTTFLGSDDEETKKFIVEKLGKTTVRSENKSWSQSNTGGSNSKSEHIDSRDLVTLDELPKIMAKNATQKISGTTLKKYDGSCIVFVNKFSPFFLKKYPAFNHPLFKQTGSSFPSGLPNNTNIAEVYKDHIREIPPKKSAVREFAYGYDEQERLHNDFENGEDIDLG